MGSCVARAAAEIYSHKNVIVTQFTQGRRAQCTSQKAAEGESNHAGIDKWLNATIIDSACAHARALQPGSRTSHCDDDYAASHHECPTQSTCRRVQPAALPSANNYGAHVWLVKIRQHCELGAAFHKVGVKR